MLFVVDVRLCCCVVDVVCFNCCNVFCVGLVVVFVSCVCFACDVGCCFMLPPVSFYCLGGGVVLDCLMLCVLGVIVWLLFGVVCWLMCVWW